MRLSPSRSPAAGGGSGAGVVSVCAVSVLDGAVVGSFAQVGAGTSLCLRYRMPQVAARLPAAPTLSRDATRRLKILDYARTHTISATCRI